MNSSFSGNGSSSPCLRTPLLAAQASSDVSGPGRDRDAAVGHGGSEGGDVLVIHRQHVDDGRGRDGGAPLVLAADVRDEEEEDGDGGGGGNRNASASASASVSAAHYLRRASSSRLMRAHSLAVRETAAEQLEERQSDWAYSRPVVVIDLMWNLFFVATVIIVLISTSTEKPETPLRVWLIGYGFQCLLHMIFVWAEYRRRHEAALSSATANFATGSASGEGRRDSTFSTTSRSAMINGGDGGGGGGGGGGDLTWREAVDRHRSGSIGIGQSNERERAAVRVSEADSSNDGSAQEEIGETTSCAKRMESANTMLSTFWWGTGFYWLTSGHTLQQDAPTLYWLCVFFLAFDVFFLIFCVALACVIGIAVCCCLPCIIAILYAVADPEGASEEDISALVTYTCQKPRDAIGVKGTEPDAKGRAVMKLVGINGSDRLISAEDAECCICITPYEDGATLRELPCSHHFHCTCIDKWLQMKATCPLCKYNIARRANNAAAVEEP